MSNNEICSAETEPSGTNRYDLRLRVNGTTHSISVDVRSSLLDLLRERLHLTGTKKGCDHGLCGACTVSVDGERVVSCLTLAASVDGSDVLTIEGIADGDDLHPLQQAFLDCDGFQCGYCTPGMIMAAVDMVNRKGPGLDEQTIRAELEGNLCRCTGYHNIVKAIAAGAEAMAAAPVREAAE